MAAVGDTLLYAGFQTFFKLWFTLFFRIRAWGKENVPRRGGVLLVPNHQSYLDPPVVGTPLPRQICYMARSTLFTVPVLGQVIPQLHAFPVEREAADLRAIRMAVGVLAEGNGLVLFPEGTRSPDGQLGEFKPGFALVAAKARVPVVPVAIDGTFEAWPRGRVLPRFGRIRVAYGEPMAAPSNDKAACLALAAGVRQRVATLLEELKRRE